MKFDEFKQDLIRRSIKSYDIPISQYNNHWENIPKYVPVSLRWMIALFTCFTNTSFDMKDYKAVFEFKVK